MTFKLYYVHIAEERPRDTSYIVHVDFHPSNVLCLLRFVCSAIQQCKKQTINCDVLPGDLMKLSPSDLLHL